jgi:hypothetical protein
VLLPEQVMESILVGGGGGGGGILEFADGR